MVTFLTRWEKVFKILELTLKLNNPNKFRHNYKIERIECKNLNK